MSSVLFRGKVGSAHVIDPGARMLSQVITDRESTVVPLALSGLKVPAY